MVADDPAQRRWFAVYEFRAELYGVAGRCLRGQDASAHAISGLQNEHAPAATTQLISSCQAGCARAHNDHLGRILEDCRLEIPSLILVASFKGRGRFAVSLRAPIGLVIR